jgi:hypothetical protein
MSNDLFGSQLERQHGERLKEHGQRRVESNATEWVENARNTLNWLAQFREFVTSDDLYEFDPPPADVHPNAVGSVFRKSGLVPCGFVKSNRASAHARMIRQWRLPS